MMISRYWAYTTKLVPRDPFPATTTDERIHNEFLQFKKLQGEEYEAKCMRINYEFACPEDVILHLNWFCSNLPEEVLVEKRPISQKEFKIWDAEAKRFADEGCAYIRGERTTAPEW